MHFKSEALPIGNGAGRTGVDFALFLSLAIQIVFNWIVTVMGVTLLTSLYGYFEEKREF